ncbi:MAG: TIM barrel protein [Thermoplasmata archaeon]|nr:TIM barrel protein [Thermoplasmata archaeon]MCI4356812.1 TIM barrel protein [Thermoplasmata archaeon]
MEVQFIKVNPLTRVVLDEEIGKAARELLLQLVVGVGAGDKPAPPSAPRMVAPLGKKDGLTTLTWSLAKDYADLAQTKALARALDVDLTLHAPYYVDFFGSQEARERSMHQIQWASVLAEGLGARMAVTHLGFYGPGSRSDSVQELTEVARELSDWLKEYSHGSVRLGIEPSGHPDVFGSREEILEVAHQVKGVVPVLNLPHLAAREHKIFETPDDLRPIVEEFVKASGGELYMNFAGVEFYGPGEFRLTPIKRGQARFDPVAELFADREYDVTVISSSPLLEHDAMYMKLLYERALAKRYAKRHAPAAPLAKKPVVPTKPVATLRPAARAPPAGPRRPVAPIAARAKPSAKRPDRGGRRRH